MDNAVSGQISAFFLQIDSENGFCAGFFGKIEISDFTTKVSARRYTSHAPHIF